jgi:hypothetical protein
LTWSNEDLAERVELEGLDYAIMYYINPEDEFEDEILKEVWLDAREALFRIERRLEKCQQT